MILILTNQTSGILFITCTITDRIGLHSAKYHSDYTEQITTLLQIQTINYQYYHWQTSGPVNVFSHFQQSIYRVGVKRRLLDMH